MRPDTAPAASDTIFALSSGAGRAGVAVIRLSGPGSRSLLEAMTGGLPRPRELALRRIVDPSSGELFDKAVAVWLPGPRSFTGEDCAEFQLHGSPSVVAAVMSTLSGFPGVRPAEPGEFTRRAFLNGKMDLVEAEGLGDLLEARTAGQRRQAMRQMSGAASSVYDAWRQKLLLIRADIEAVVDFADEPGVAEEAAAGISAAITDLRDEMERALAASSSAEIIRDGIRVVLAGPPNTGKSSLLNWLARREAAIVSDIPGTTRDAIEVAIDLDGLPVILTDTAGLRGAPADAVEAEGIRRSRGHMASADVLVWVESPDVAGSATPDHGVTPDILLRNKSDLAALSGVTEGQGPLCISTRTGDGMAAFLNELRGLLGERYGAVESSLFVSARQKRAATESIRLLNDALAVPAERLELMAEHVRQASDEIGRLTGRVDVEEWLGVIFSRFCIGK